MAAPRRKRKQKQQPARKANTKYKDTVIRDMFKEKKRAIEFFNATHAEQLPDDTPVKIIDLDAAIFTEIRNDISFIIANRFIVLIEAQSTFSPNIALRFLMYFSALLELYLTDRKEELYGTKKINLPTPEFIVLYTGANKVPEISEVKLSDLFSEIPAQGYIELVARTYDITQGKNINLLAKSQSLDGFSYLVSRVEKYIADGYDRADALSMAVKDCVAAGKLTDYLTPEKIKEVLAMLSFEYDQKLHDRKLREESLEEGIQKGVHQKAVHTAQRLIKQGDSYEKIADATELTVEEVTEIAAAMSKTA